MELKKGMRVTCVMAGTEVKDAVIQEENTFFYICQNQRGGGNCEDKKGYKYSWFVGSDADNIEEHDVLYLRVVSSNIEGIFEGAIVKNQVCQRKVLGICGDVHFLSATDDFDKLPLHVSYYTMVELKQHEYVLVVEEPEDDTVDITVEGRTKTISRTSAKELNLID